MGNENAKDHSRGFGLRVLGVDKNSALLHAVALFEDFIIEINGYSDLRNLKGDFEFLGGKSEKITLMVYNLISDATRSVVLEQGYDHAISLEQQLGIRFKLEDLECA